MRKFLLFTFFAIISFHSQARKFYISSSAGSDTYSVTQAQNASTPWKTLVKVQTFGNSGQAMAGDTFAFKSGDLFTNGYNWFGSFRWWATNGYSCPSGTASNPIVFTSYGTGAKPNFLFPYPTTTAYNEKHVFALQGVKYIVIDGLQFNDTRFAVNDKVSTAYTSTGVLLGERGTTSSVSNCTVKNCYFSNIGYGIQLAGDNNTILNNVFINMKNVGDTSGSVDVGAIPIVLNTGKFNMVKNNYLKGGWAFSSATASGRGLNGGGVELLNDFDSSWIIYNTIIDCEGGIETGQNIFQPTSGPNDDVIAYNLFLNNGKICYANTGPSLSSGTGRLRFYNNVYVENSNSRFSGDKYGMDVFGDGQSFSQFPTWPNFPQNPSYTNFGGWRPLQYTTENGVLIDTVMISRNNIFWMTNYNQAIYDNSRVKFFHANNIYHLVGRSVMGGTLNTGDFLEMNTIHKLFIDTSNINPEFWDFNSLSNSPAINFGRNVGFNSDISGNSLVGNPDAGIKEFINSSSGSLLVSVNVGNISCYGATTSAIVTATGGVSPYTGVGTFSVGAGTQNFTVTDANGNRQTQSVTISQPPAIVPSVSAGRITTTGGTTTITVTAIGGTGAYTYKLNTGTYRSSGSFTGVAAGTHTISVKDANGCVVSSTIVITQPASLLNLNLSAQNNQILCYGGNTTITATATGGTAPYTYSLGTGTYQNSNQFAGITAGIFTFNVKDSNGVVKSADITLLQPTAALAGTVTAGAINVHGALTTVTVSNVSGGTAPYTYSINGGVFQTTASFSNVGAGSHIVTIKDSKGCVLDKSITIIQPAPPLPPSISITQPTCSVATGTVTITSSTTGLTFSKDGVTYQTSNVFSGLVAGAYNITSKTSGGIVSSAVVATILGTTPPAPAGIVGTKNISKCDSLQTYSVVNPVNGYTYTWAVTGTGNSIKSGQGSSSVVIAMNVAGTVSVKATKCTAAGPAASFTVTKGSPSTPSGVYQRFIGSSSVAADINICKYTQTAFAATGVKDTFRIRTIAFATGYHFQVPAGASMTRVNDTTIAVVFADTTSAGATVKAYSLSACDTSVAKVLTLTRTLAATPSGIFTSFNANSTSGPAAVTSVCSLVGGGSSTYMIRKVATAQSYIWSLRRGTNATFTRLATAGINDTSYTVTFAAGFTRDTLEVKSVNGCGVSVAKTVILNALLATPTLTALTAEAGNTTPCIGNVVTYTATSLTPTTSQAAVAVYRWTKPNFTTITSATADSSSIILSYNTGFTGGSISVKPQSACGVAGSAKTMALQYLPPSPTAITSSTGVYNFCIGSSATFTATLATPNTSQRAAVVYRWTKPNNTVIMSAASDSSSITLQFNTGYTGGAVTVKGQTACGALGAAKSQSITHTGCPAGAKLITGKGTELKDVQASVYPSPSNGNFTVNIATGMEESGIAQIQLIDMYGKVVAQYSATNNAGRIIRTISNNKLADGMYTIKYTFGNTSGVTKMMIHH